MGNFYRLGSFGSDREHHLEEPSLRVEWHEIPALAFLLSLPDKMVSVIPELALDDFFVTKAP